MLLSGDALRASVVCEDGQSVAETWSRLRDTFDIFECKNNFATAGKDPNPEHWWTERPPDMLINGVLKVDGCMPVRFEVQVHHKDILERKEKQSHLLYEIQRAASVEEVRGSGAAVASASSKDAPTPRVNETSVADKALLEQLAAQREEIAALRRGNTGAAAASSSRTPLRLKLRGGKEMIWISSECEWQEEAAASAADI